MAKFKIGDKVYAKEDIPGDWTDDLVLGGTIGEVTLIIPGCALDLTVKFQGSGTWNVSSNWVELFPKE